MLTLVKNLNQRALIVEAPSFFISLLIAENAFKFHSFTLECCAFLTLWTALSALIQRFTNKVFKEISISC